MADHSRKRAVPGKTMAALAIIGALIGTTAASAPAAASDRLAETVVPALVATALFYGLTHAQADHIYDRGHYFDPRYYYYDQHRGHWRARNNQRRSHTRDHRRNYQRRHYSHNRYYGDGYGYGASDHDRRDRNQRRRGHNRRGHGGH